MLGIVDLLKTQSESCHSVSIPTFLKYFKLAFWQTERPLNSLNTYFWCVFLFIQMLYFGWFYALSLFSYTYSKLCKSLCDVFIFVLQFEKTNCVFKFISELLFNRFVSFLIFVKHISPIFEEPVSRSQFFSLRVMFL